jgi:hypothetical protein
MLSGAGVVMGSTALALPHYGSGALGTACLRADGRDVVYEVAIPAGTRLAVTVTPLTSFDVAVNLVANAAACGTAAGGMQCLTGADASGAGSVEQLSFTNAGPARTALLVVDGYGSRDSGSFALAVAFTPITTGDTCEAPTTLTPGTPLTNQLLTGFMDDYGVTSSGRCQFHSDADRVYAVQVPAGQRLQAVITPSTNFDPSFSLLTGVADCAAGVCANGVDEFLSGEPERLQWDNLSATAQTVLLVVDAVSATGSFTINATLSASPSVVVGGDTCAAPATLDAGTFLSTTAARQSRFDFFENGGCAATSTAPDTVFSLTVPPSSMVRATVTPNGWDAVLNVVSSPGACGFTTDAGTLGATCLGSSDGPRTSSVEQVVVRNVTSAPTTALLVVDGHDHDAHGPFTIATEVLPLASMPGDVCQAPQPITSSGHLSGLTTTSYLNDVETASSCTGFQNRGADRVFSITVPAGTQLTAVALPNGWDASLYVIDPTACGMSTTCLDGSDSATSGAETVRFTNGGMSDRTVYLVVDSYSSSGAGTFDLFTSITP